MNEITDLITFLKTRIKETKQQDKKENSTQTRKTQYNVSDKQQTQQHSFSQPIQEEKELVPKTEKPIESLTPKQIIGKDAEEKIGDKIMMINQRLGQKPVQEIISRLCKNVWIKDITISRSVVKRGNKRYYYVRKRVELPRDFNSMRAVVLRAEDFVDLIMLISELSGIPINYEKIVKLLIKD